jgi:hypothetical protein
VLELAARAPSAHNTQPWRVEQRGDRLLVFPDEARHLRHSDPARRDLHLALGGFVLALEWALAAEGTGSERAAPPGGAFCALHLAGPCTPRPEGASLLRRRESSRLEYTARPPAPEELDALAAVASAHGLRLVTVAAGTAEHADWCRHLSAASRESWLDVRAVEELRAWVRFDPEGTRPPVDGLSTHCLGLDVPTAVALKGLLQPRLWKELGTAWAAPALAGVLASDEAAQAERTPLLGVLVEQGGRPTSDPAVGTGMLATWLEATRLRLALHPLSALLDRRGWELARRLGVSAPSLLFAFRLGRSTPPPRSGRRAVRDFATWEALP